MVGKAQQSGCVFLVRYVAKSLRGPILLKVSGLQGARVVASIKQIRQSLRAERRRQQILRRKKRPEAKKFVIRQIRMVVGRGPWHRFARLIAEAYGVTDTELRQSGLGEVIDSKFCRTLYKY